jgi:hypothetical protein
MTLGENSIFFRSVGGGGASLSFSFKEKHKIGVNTECSLDSESRRLFFLPSVV